MLDLMMPGMDGWQFLEQHHADPVWARIPVVVVSAHGTVERVRSMGAADYLTKPFAFAQLLALVAKHCGQRVDDVARACG